MVVIHKAEIAALVIVIVGAAAQFADFLPPRYDGIFLAVWALLRVYLRATGQNALIEEANSLGAELKQDHLVMTAKKP